MWRLKHENKQTQKQTNNNVETPHVASLPNILYLKNWDKMCLY